MGYRREDIPEMIVALKAAKRHLWNGRDQRAYGRKEEFVCHALRASGYGYGRTEELIQSVLFMAKTSTFCDWVDKNVKENAGPRVTQPLRRKWIDKMIHDLQQYAKGAP